MNGLKKAALFLSSLEYVEADQLLSRLDGASAKLIRREIMSLRHDSLPPEESHRLDEEFLCAAGWQPATSRQEHQFASYTSPQRPSSRSLSASGTSENKSSLDALAYKRPVAAPVKYTAAACVPPVRSFDFMRAWSPHDIVTAVIDEHPQAIAVVLAHLPQSKMQLVLAALPPDLQHEIQERLNHYEMPDEQIVQEIESALKVRYRHQHQPVRSSARLQSFDEVETLSDSELATLFRSIDLTKAMLALIGAEPTLIARVTRHFSPTEEHEMRTRLQRFGHIDEDHITQARRDILMQYNATA